MGETAQRFEASCVLPVDRGEAFAWHERPGAFERLVPPWTRVEVVERRGGLDGGRLEMRLRKGPLRLPWVARHEGYERGARFRDVQVRGPFARWEHEHRFERLGSRSARLTDSVDYALRGGRLAASLFGRKVRGEVERMFAYRHATTVADLELHRRLGGTAPLQVGISGAGGLVGRALSALLTTGGHRVRRLVRGAAAGEEEIGWDPEWGLLEPREAEGLDAVVHLAGESIAAGRWTVARKERIRDSRIEGTRRLVESLGALARPPKVFLCASATGYYGDRGREVLHEESAPGTGFLAEVCRGWEGEALRASGFGARVVRLRFGIVLSPAGGALGRVLPPFLAGGGGVLGSGRQWVSWIGIDDAVSAIFHALVHAGLEGPLAVVSPHPVTNREFTSILSRVLRRPALVSLPRPAVRLLFGRMGVETLLASTRVLPVRLQESGYSFRHEELEGALRHLLGRRGPRRESLP